MRKIGLRTIKTAISVFLCLMVFILLKAIELVPGVPENLAFDWYNPFFAGIATAYSVHSSKKASMVQAKNRCVASVIGGVIGIILVSLYELCGGVWPTLNTIDLYSFNYVLPYLLIVLCTILVILTGIFLNQRNAIFVAILTFLSVSVNPNKDVSMWQWQFGLNRILSTVVGVLIALGVNLFRLPRFRTNKNLLFCVGIDGMLLSDSDHFKGFIQYKLNDLNERKANVTLFTTRTPTTFMPLLNDVKVNHPIICMSGAALYDTTTFKYLSYENIDIETSNKLRKLLTANNITPFINMINDDVLFTYNEKIDNLGENKYAESKKNASYCCFIKEEAPYREVLYFLIVEEEKKVNNIIRLIHKDEELKNKTSILVYDVFENNQPSGLKYIKIYNKSIENQQIIKDYALSQGLSVVGLIASNNCDYLLKNSDIAVALETIDEDVKEYCDRIIKSNVPDDLFKEVNKMYYKNLAKYRK